MGEPVVLVSLRVPASLMERVRLVAGPRGVNRWFTEVAGERLGWSAASLASEVGRVGAAGAVDMSVLVRGAAQDVARSAGADTDFDTWGA